MLQNLIHGLTALDSPQAIAYLVGGSLLGMFLGVIPGLGGAVILSIVLAFIYHINLTGAICLFLAVQAASYFSASVTSILLNTPAHPEAFAVTFDGFPMAQRGEAGRALGISATSTCIGGLVGCAVLVGFFQIINYLPNIFHPPELIGLVIFALLLVGTLGTDAASKAVMSAGIGIMISSIGSDPVSGALRYTFGSVQLFGGISLVSLALGLFAIPQMVLIFGTATTIARQDLLGNDIDAASPVTLEKGFARQAIQGMGEALHHWVALLRASLIGVITGVIPGIGGFAANFLSYGIAQQVSKHGELFGTGIPEGIIAPEGSSLSKEAGGLVPLIGLGIPGGVGMALFLAALTIKNLKPGYGFAQQHPTLPYEMMWVIALAGIIGTFVGLLATPFLAKVTKVPGPLIVPIIMSLAVIGPFVAVASFFAVMEVAVFGVIGLTLRRLRYSLASFAIGLVLGTTLEANIYLTRTVYPGWTFLKRPIADVLFVLSVAVLISKTIQLHRSNKLSYPPIVEVDPELRGQEEERRSRARHPYPLLAIIATTAILIFAIMFAVYGATQYDFKSSLMPVVASSVAALAALWRLPFEARGYIEHRQIRTHLVQFDTPELDVVPTHVEDESGSPSALKHAALAPVVLKSWGIHGQYSREITALLWFGALIFLCYFFGFTIGVPAFVAAYGLLATRRVFSSLFGRILYTVCSAVVMCGVSYEMLHLLHLTFTPIINL